jgi:hypothetical protein
VRKIVPQSVKWLPVIYAGLAVWGLACAFITGLYFSAPHAVTHNHKTPERAFISSGASLAQVNGNLKGKPYVHGSLSELPGFTCDGWTNGKNGTGWVVIRCFKAAIQ